MTEVARAAAMTDETLASIRLCVSEAVSNAVVHAYRLDAVPGEVVVEALDHDGTMEVTVRDRGSGMRARPDSPGAGFGLGLIAQIASDVTIDAGADDVGTQVAMRFVREPQTGA